MKPILLLLLLFIQTMAFAQKEATHWYFGDRAGFSFSKGHAAALADGAMQAWEGCATISNPETGELLFYTNGIQVWNRQHQVMPNGSGLLSDLSSTQAALIVPFPGYPQRYYLFTVNAPIHTTSPHGLTYSIVNMGLEGGLGDVENATKNTRLLSFTSEKLTAVPHANGQDYWVITHGYDNDEFYVFLLTKAEVSGPYTFSVGMDYQGGDSGDYTGYLKASPDGKKLVCAVYAKGQISAQVPIELFDFDAATGIVSNAVSLSLTTDIPVHYGVSFSPDNSKLYVSGIAVFQFDLSLPSIQEIINSQVQITTTPSHGSLGSTQSLQLGPDGRLYNNVNRENQNAFYVINYPNRAGMACEPELVEYDFKGGRGSVGLPNFIQSYFNGLEPIEGEQQECEPIIQLYPNPTTGTVRFMKDEYCGDVQTFSLRVVNSIGQTISEVQTGLTMADEVDISGYAAGLYLFTLTFPNSQQVVGKVVKVD